MNQTLKRGNQKQKKRESKAEKERNKTTEREREIERERFCKRHEGNHDQQYNKC